MSTKALVIGLVGAGCVVAAGAGGFLAQRVSGPGAETGSIVEAAPPPVTTMPAPVAGTEVSVEPTRPAVAPPRQPATRSAVVQPRPTVPARAEPDVSRSSPPPPPAPPDVVPPDQPPPVIAEPPVTELPPPPPDPAAVATDPVEVAEEPRLIEVTVAEDSVIGIRLESGVSSESAKVEDRVSARVTRDVVVDGRTAIPAGARLEGNVTLVERGGKFKERARLGLRFTRLVLSDNSSVRIQTDAIIRDGDSPTREAASKVGASAVIGAILGGVIGGKKGAVIGGSAGAGGGAAAVAAGGRNEATLVEGTPLTVRLTADVTILVERNEGAPIR
jgi:hypothetical protein